MYTSIQGSMMFIIGLLGLILKYQDVTPKVTHNMLSQPLIFPIAVLVPTILGLVFQQLHSPPAKEGGKGGRRWGSLTSALLQPINCVRRAAKTLRRPDLFF
jgi:hypothetical protein